MHLTTFYQNSLYCLFRYTMHSINLYLLCQTVMHALSFLPGNELFCGRFQSGNEPDSFRGWGLLRLTFYSTSTQQYALSSYRAARDTSHRFYYSLSYSSQASNRMRERARMLLICAVVALYNSFASCRPDDYPFRNWTLPWEERVMVS